ncbi:MAG: MFS transporter [Ruminococcaceae bacterium]|nr:MFS transporter [Oscillospiraceae bacterium]
MTIIKKGISLVRDVRAYWKHPAPGDYVAYKEYFMLSIGWLGMRLATSFGFGFGVNDAFTATTLHMTHRDLIILGYICTAIGYVTAPLNAYIIDHLRSRDGKYRVYVKLAIPAAILSMFALFFPYEKVGYMKMVVSLFLIGQIEGYVKGWYSTGVSNLVYVLSPNSQERVRIMTVTSLVHNFAPSLTGIIMPVMADLFADGNLYNINTYRMIYPVFIIVGCAMSMTAYFGVRERIIQPVSEVADLGFLDALRAVTSNRYFWIKCTDAWNDFMESCKNILLQWVFHYGKVGSMSMYGVIDTLTYNSSMWAMLFSPTLIRVLGKRKFKIVKNTSQVFITLGLLLTYKKSIFLIAVFFFLNRFWDTTEVVDRAIESDIRDYQQYLSGERIDGAFGLVEHYVGGAVGAVTNLFVPWVYRKNGFDGTDYSVLMVYDDNGNYNEGNVLYSLLDVLMKISLVGAVIDIIPWFFYDLTEAGQKGVIRVIRLRSAAEDKAAGLLDDKLYCEACEGIFAAKEYENQQEQTIIRTKDKDERAANKEKKHINEEIEIAAFVNTELNRFNTPFGAAILDLSEKIVSAGENGYFLQAEELLHLAKTLPKGATSAEKTQRRDMISLLKSLPRIANIVKKQYPDGVQTFDPADLENAYNMPTNTAEQKKARSAAIRTAKRERNSYAKVTKPYLAAKRNLILDDCYRNLDSFLADYDAAKARVEEEYARMLKVEAQQKAQRALETQRRLESKQAKKKIGKR